MTKERILRWESSQRYYAARVQRDLLGDLTLSTAWGGRDNALGNTDTVPLPDEQAVSEALAEIQARRTAHQYELVLDKLL